MEADENNEIIPAENFTPGAEGEDSEELLNNEEVVEEFNIPSDDDETELELVSEDQANQETINSKNEPKIDKIVRLPLTRVKTIIKTDSDVNLVSHDAVFLIAKATELFIESLTEEAYEYTAQAKRKTLCKRDIDLAIENIESLIFLEGIFD